MHKTILRSRHTDVSITALIASFVFLFELILLISFATQKTKNIFIPIVIFVFSLTLFAFFLNLTTTSSFLWSNDQDYLIYKQTFRSQVQIPVDELLYFIITTDFSGETNEHIVKAILKNRDHMLIYKGSSVNPQKLISKLCQLLDIKLIREDR